MNKLAEELNALLDDTNASHLLSRYGKELFFPKGIVSQSVEAKTKATRFNATIGMAMSGGRPMILDPVRRSMPQLTPGEMVTYAPTPGLPSLRKEWNELLEQKNPGLKGIRRSLPMVVPGLTGGISTIADMFVDPEDTVIIPDMFWGNYRLIFEVRKQARIVDFPFFTEEGGFNLEAFKETVNKPTQNGKIIVMLNFPNNPTGYTPTKSEMNGIAEILKETAENGINILLITDDAYFGLFYDANTDKESFFSRAANLHSRILAVKIDGATKEDYVWGFRIGFTTFSGAGYSTQQLSALETKLKGALRGSFSNSTHPGQEILLRALKDAGYSAEKTALEKDLTERYHTVKKIVENRKDSRVLQILPFNSGYFMAFKTAGSAEELRVKLLEEEGIGTISIKDQYLRIAYASVDNADLPALYEAVYRTAEEIFQ